MDSSFPEPERQLPYQRVRNARSCSLSSRTNEDLVQVTLFILPPSFLLRCENLRVHSWRNKRGRGPCISHSLNSIPCFKLYELFCCIPALYHAQWNPSMLREHLRNPHPFGGQWHVRPQWRRKELHHFQPGCLPSVWDPDCQGHPRRPRGSRRTRRTRRVEPELGLDALADQSK